MRTVKLNVKYEIETMETLDSICTLKEILDDLFDDFFEEFED